MDTLFVLFFLRQRGQCFRRSSPLRGSPPFSGANAGSSINPAGFKKLFIELAQGERVGA